MYLDDYGKFLVIFVQKYFLTLLKMAKKTSFGDFSKIQFLAKNLTIQIDILWNSLSKMYTFIYSTLLVFKLWQKLFSQKTTKLRGWHRTTFFCGMWIIKLGSWFGLGKTKVLVLRVVEWVALIRFLFGMWHY